jgi:hypothetical protein
LPLDLSFGVPLLFIFFLGLFLSFVLCCGGLFATTSTARSKRDQASERTSVLELSPLESLLAMPQPIHHSDHIFFQFTSPSLLKRPELAAHIAAISMQWNEIEARVATLLTALLGGEAKTGISIFFAITSDGAKRAAVDAICNLKLPSDSRAALQDILHKIGERYTDRNTVIHGAWGISPKYPDALLWSDIKEAILLHVDLMSLQGEGNQIARDQRRLAYQKTLRVWKEQDFVAVEDRLLAAYREIHNFSTPIIQEAFGPMMRSVDPPTSLLPR